MQKNIVPETVFCFVGDLSPSCMYSENPEILAQRLIAIREQVPENAILFFNLECSIFDGCDGRDTEANLEALRSLSVLKPAVANLSNNHHFDSGIISSEQITAVLDDLKIPYVGLYDESLSSHNILELNELRIAVVARTARGTNPQSSGSDTLGILPLEYSNVLNICEGLINKVDFTVVCLHWGAEYYKKPSPRQKCFVKSLSKLGVNVVWGHHAHVLQPRLQVGDMLVMYNMGNFIFGESFEGRWPNASQRAALVGYEKSADLVACWEVGFDIDNQKNSMVLKSKKNIKQCSFNKELLDPIQIVFWFFYRIYMEILFFGANYIKKRLLRHKTQTLTKSVNKKSYTSGKVGPRMSMVIGERLRRVVALWEDE